MKILLIVLAVLLVIAIVGVIILNHPCFGRRMSKERKARIDASPNWRDGQFQNQIPTPQFTGDKSMFGALWEFLTDSKKDRTPKEAVPAVKTDLKSLPTDRDWLMWFGHSSYLFCLDGKRYLVDPVFSNNASPLPHNVVPFGGTNIYSADDMPEIDYLIITHDHYDHLDYETILALKPKVKHVITGLGVGSHFRYWGYDKNIIQEMDWNESIDIDGGKLYALPARHFAGRLFENRTLWTSYLLESNGYKLFIGGDSGYDNHLKMIGDKFGSIDFALLEAGQYDKNWRYIHEMPEEFIQSAMDIKTKRIIPVHNSKFSICNHTWYDPLDRISDLAANTDLNIITPKIGEVVELKNNSQQFSPWWKEVK